MFALLAYAWSSAVVTGLLGTLPGRSFRFRVTVVALVLTLGSVMTFAVANFLVGSLVGEEKLPEGVRPGEWAMLGLYLPAVTQWLGLLLMVVVAYFLRLRLLPIEEPDTRERKTLALAAVVAIALIVVIPLSLDGFLLRMIQLSFQLVR